MGGARGSISGGSGTVAVLVGGVARHHRLRQA